MPSWRARSTSTSSASDSTGVGSPRAGGEPARGEPGVLDEMLVQRARDGDHAAFRALYERYAAMVHGVLLARAPRQDADDLMQDVFLSAWQGLHKLRDDEHVGGWLAVIARNRAARFHMRAKPAAEPLHDELPDARAESSDERHEGQEALSLLRRLPDAYRETLAMRLVEGMTGPQIAEATGLSHGSVRVNLSRGMKKYKELLKAEGWS